ncbi:MAG: DNA-primase RepB domain-containing protein, partial [Verrucomicrobiales bacterium]
MSAADQSVPEMDLPQAVAFLKGMHPEEDWNLVTIHAETSRITATGFGPNDEDKAKAWIEEHNAAGFNIYFHVGSAGQVLTRKARKEDIANVGYLWVDIDAKYKEGQTVEEARAAAIEALDSQPDGIPKPTYIVSSGGGIQAFWKLKDPVQIKDRNENAAEIESRNKHLEKVFGADNCSNIDRIMRLPGTINWPNAKKRKYGRVPAPAKLLEHDPE